MTLMSDAARAFCERCRVARLATADARGVPHLVPVCYAIVGNSLYITIDEKPKRIDIPLKRLRNISEISPGSNRLNHGSPRDAVRAARAITWARRSAG